MGPAEKTTMESALAGVYPGERAVYCATRVKSNARIWCKDSGGNESVGYYDDGDGLGCGEQDNDNRIDQGALDKSEGVVKTEISWAVREPAFSPEKVEDQDSGNLT